MGAARSPWRCSKPPVASGSVLLGGTLASLAQVLAVLPELPVVAGLPQLVLIAAGLPQVALVVAGMPQLVAAGLPQVAALPQLRLVAAALPDSSPLARACH